MNPNLLFTFMFLHKCVPKLLIQIQPKRAVSFTYRSKRIRNRSYLLSALIRAIVDPAMEVLCEEGKIVTVFLAYGEETEGV